MTINNRISGILRLTSPLHCASPDKTLIKLEDKDRNQTPTVQQRIVTRNGQQQIPYFPGNDLRGRLRRKAAALVLDHVTASSKITPELYTGLTAGAVSASPESGLTVEEALRARGNVYMGLFGGGNRLLRSRFHTSDVVPVVDATLEVGMVPKSFGDIDGQNFVPKMVTSTGEKPIEGWQLIQVTQVLRVDDLQRVLRPDEVVAYIDNAAETVAKFQSQNLESRVARKASKASAAAGDIKQGDIAGKKEVGNVMTFQSILAGTPMYCLIDLDDDTTDAHVGLMLLSLQALVREQKLGGWCRAGLGRFDATLTLTRGGETYPVFSSDCAGADAQLSAQTQVFVDAARAGIAEQTEAGLMAFFESRVPAAKDKKAAKADEADTDAEVEAA